MVCSSNPRYGWPLYFNCAVADSIRGDRLYVRLVSLISAGLIFKDHKLVPTTWIHDIQEDEVHLNVSAATLKNLPEYQETTA